MLFYASALEVNWIQMSQYLHVHLHLCNRMSFIKKDLFNDDFGPSGSKKETRSLHSWHDNRLNKSWQVIKLMMKNDSAICGLQPTINCMITHQAGVNYQWLCIINYVKRQNFKINILFNLSKPHTVCLIDRLFQLALLFYKTQ